MNSSVRRNARSAEEPTSPTTNNHAVRSLHLEQARFDLRPWHALGEKGSG